MSVTLTTQQTTQLRGNVKIPGDKSISHRSLMFGALADGITQVHGFLDGEDCLATLQALTAMGVHIQREGNHVTVHGVGIDGLQTPKQSLNMGNSGTSMRLFSGILAGQSFRSEICGDASLSKRPMRRVIDPLRLMGAEINGTEANTAPLHVTGGRKLQGIDYMLPMASAQVKSCVLLAGMYAQGCTRTTEPAPTRDHTERMLRGFGYTIEQETPRIAALEGGGRLTATTVHVPADISSAAFFMVAASIAADADLTLERVGINPTRTGVINILQAMGADIELFNRDETGGEPVADIRIRSAALHGITIDPALVPLAIDEFPVLFVAAACAEGTTILTGAEELRAKESDRIQVMADGLVALGIDVLPTPDGIVIHGGRFCHNATIQTHHDHRIAMAFAVAGIRSAQPIVIQDAEFVDTSFPGFVELAQHIGMNITRT